jgi:hypothetical protein
VGAQRQWFGRTSHSHCDTISSPAPHRRRGSNDIAAAFRLAQGPTAGGDSEARWLCPTAQGPVDIQYMLLDPLLRSSLRRWWRALASRGRRAPAVAVHPRGLDSRYTPDDGAVRPAEMAAPRLCGAGDPPHTDVAQPFGSRAVAPPGS